MRGGAVTAVLCALLAIGACGGGDRHDTAAKPVAPSRPPAARDARPAEETRLSSQLDSALAAQGVLLNEAGRVETYATAGFEVYWPSGCGRLLAGEPEVVDPTVRQEFRYACDRFNTQGRGFSVYVLQNGRDENGGPPSPAMVVQHIEAALAQYGVRAERQRPLEAPGFEGVEVQAVQPAGKGEVWIRGLLVGPHIYVLTAWDTNGGIFEDPEIRDFFASFRLIS